MSSNNTNNFQGNAGTSSNNADAFAEIISVGGGVGQLYNSYLNNVVDNPGYSSNTYQQNFSGPGLTRTDGAGGASIAITSYPTYENAALQEAQIVMWSLVWAAPDALNLAPDTDLTAYWNAYVAGGDSLPAEMAIPFANIFFKMMRDKYNGIPAFSGGV